MHPSFSASWQKAEARRNKEKRKKKKLMGSKTLYYLTYPLVLFFSKGVTHLSFLFG
jgi:hypothetical protein